MQSEDDLCFCVCLLITCCGPADRLLCGCQKAEMGTYTLFHGGTIKTYDTHGTTADGLIISPELIIDSLYWIFENKLRQFILLISHTALDGSWFKTLLCYLFGKRVDHYDTSSSFVFGQLCVLVCVFDSNA